MRHFSLLTCCSVLTTTLFTSSLAQASGPFDASLNKAPGSLPPSANTQAAPENIIKLEKHDLGGTSSRVAAALAGGNGAPEVDGTYGTDELGATQGGELVHGKIFHRY